MKETTKITINLVQSLKRFPRLFNSIRSRRNPYPFSITRCAKGDESEIAQRCTNHRNWDLDGDGRPSFFPSFLLTVSCV